ncbi:MAG: glycoside hydrolase family 3 C-terminal domain-containing protein [Dehalococcoidia bacterium]
MATIDELLSEMTLEEKCTLLSGANAWTIPGCERLGVSSWTVSDGPIGVRGRGRSPALCLPSSTAWAATWDVELVAEMGAAVAREAKDRAIQMVLGPTVNMHRDPRGGRHFECYSEDPFLTSRIAVAYIRALQAEGIGACLKHYVANDQEFERHSMSSDVPERPLREIYLAPFEAAVKEAGVKAVMAAYNDINGVQACEHVELNEGVLRGEWGFEGLIISDWWAVKGTARAAIGGLDVEMPGPGRFWGHGRLADAVAEGEVPEAVVDAKVRRVLSFLEWAGGIGNELPGDVQEGSVDRPEDRELARRAATESMVLLKNDGVLPLDPEKLTRVAVLGPNAENTVLLGGGSATVFPHHTTNVLDSLRERLGAVEVAHVPAPPMTRRVPDFTPDLVGQEGVRVEVFEGREPSGAPVLTQQVTRPLFNWSRETWPVAGPDLTVRATCTLTPNVGGRWRLGMAGLGAVRLMLDGAAVADSREGHVNSSMEQVLAFGWADLEAGRAYEVVAEYRAARHHMGTAMARFGGAPDPADPGYLERCVEAARSADVAIVVTGTNTEVESEGADRLSIALPGEQDDLVRAVAAANPRTVVVNNSGSPVLMPWVDEVAAIVQAWFPGQEGGDAITDVLLGEAEPGGRMPTTWAKRIEDTPAFTNYPGENGHVLYGEGVFMGYRWYDARDIEPLWPFGHGLSYTTFAWGDPRVRREGDQVVVTVEVTNTGSRRGTEVVQCYVAPTHPPLARPPQELKGFARLDLAPGETGTARMVLDPRTFSAWDPSAHGWVVDGAPFELRLGASSRDIRTRIPWDLET